MDLSHGAWSDIFFLGMDFPEGARVLNVSIDLAVRGRDRAPADLIGGNPAQPRPPVEAYLRVIDEPILRLVSVDLGARADITSLPEVFDFAKDYLGLLKAAIIAAGIIPPGMEGSGENLTDLLARIGGEIELNITDNGVGFDPETARTKGLGLLSIEERVHLANGQFSVTSRLGGGSRLSVSVPVGWA